MFTKFTLAALKGPAAAIDGQKPLNRRGSLRRVAIIAASLAIVAGALSPVANARVYFTDGSSAETALACYAQGNNLIINGQRVRNPLSWLVAANHATSSNIWTRTRFYDWTLGSWSTFSTWALMTPGVTGQTRNGAYLNGGYTFELEYAKQIGGVWQYRRQTVRVLNVFDRMSSINYAPLLNDYSITNAVCQQ